MDDYRATNIQTDDPPVIDLPDTLTFDGTNPIFVYQSIPESGFVELEFKTAGLSSTGYLFGHFASGGNRVYLFVNSLGHLFARIGSGPNTLIAENVDNDQWHTVQLVYGTLNQVGQARAYFDGSFAATVANPASPLTINTQFTLGAVQTAGGGSTQAPFVGDVRNVKIYDSIPQSATDGKRVVIPAGQLAALVQLTAIGDVEFEPTESIIAQIDSVSGAVIQGGQVTASLLDDGIIGNPPIVVSNADDSGPGSLRQAILDAETLPNADGLPDQILVDIPGNAVHLIELLSSLPTITESLIIDATADSDYAGVPVIQLHGGNTLADGIRIAAGNSQVRGLSVTGFTDSGIELVNGGNNLIAQNYLGVTPDGAGDGNYFGIRVQVSGSNLIEDNVISGNNRAGVFVTGVAATNNTIQNNRIGTAPSGTAARPNATDGVTLFAPNNTVQNNLISGNTRWGVLTSQSHATNNIIIANQIGVDVSGTMSIDNLSGVTLQSGSNTVHNNVISGNRAFGVSLSMAGSIGNSVTGNRIGTDDSGSLGIGNAIVGVRATGASNNTVGGTSPSDRNIISGNGGFGVLLALPGTDNNVVTGNHIGTNHAGTSAVGNTSNGVRLAQGAKQNVISQNVVSGNGTSGISTGDANTISNDIIFNLIGTDASGTIPLHNGTGGALRLLSPETHVEGNIISGPDTGIVAFRDANHLSIIANFIGTDAAESVTTLGMPTGISLSSGANDAVINNNVIANNQKGIVLVGTASRIRIDGNSIYDNAILGIDLANNGVNTNDVGDGDTGPNQLQNSAYLSTAVLSGGDLIVTYRVDSTPVNSNYGLTIQFFVADSGGSGRTLIGQDDYLLAEASQSKTVTLNGVLVSLGDTITATVIDQFGNTSEFSITIAVS